MQELEIFDALKQMDFGQVMIQVSELDKPYHSKGTVLCWDQKNIGRLINYNTRREVSLCKPLDGTISKWIIKDEVDFKIHTKE